MRLKEVSESEKITYSKLAKHPLQSWEWGDFRNSYGTKTYRLGHYNGNKLLATFELTSHPIPKTGYVILVCFRSSVPSPEVLREFQDFGKAKSALCIKFEPNVNKLVNGIENKNFNRSKKYLLSNGCALGRAQFARYSFIIDLGKKEDDIFTNFNSKTRYNVRLASKHGVKVVEDNSPAAWDAYWRLTQETTQRQHFYSHNLHYHRLLWEHLKPAGMAHLLTATFHGEVLSTWMLFLFNDLLYYPYGAWSGKHKEVMANNLMMWEAIRWGKAHGAKKFDLWGAAGPETPKDDPWQGFTRFKEGYGGDLVEFLGSYDLVINKPLYKIYRQAESLRWSLLRLRKILPF